MWLKWQVFVLCKVMMLFHLWFKKTTLAVVLKIYWEDQGLKHGDQSGACYSNPEGLWLSPQWLWFSWWEIAWFQIYFGGRGRKMYYHIGCEIGNKKKSKLTSSSWPWTLVWKIDGKVKIKLRGLVVMLVQQSLLKGDKNLN